MANIYDMIRQQMQSIPITREGYEAAAYNPNDVNPSFKGPASPIWEGLQGQNFYSPGQGYGAAPNMDWDAMWKYLSDNGLEWRHGSLGNESASWIQGPSGPIEETANLTQADDRRFWNAALAAAALTGANIAAAGAGGAAGAQTFPVNPGGVDVTTQLGQLASTGASTGAGVAASAGLPPMAEMAGVAASAAPAASAASGFNWSSLLSGQGLRSGIDILSGLYGMKLAKDAREASDPFAGYRPGYGEALARLEANPNLITQRPGWLAGTELIGRQMASRGYTGSGNERAALQRYAGDFYNQEANRLATLAGAGQTPGAGQFTSAQLASQSLGSIGYGIAPWLPNKP